MTHLRSPRYISIAVLTALALSGCSQSSAPDDAAAPAAKWGAAVPAAAQSPQTGMMDHSHIPVAVPENIASPSLSIMVERDWMSGLNLSLHTENYALVPPPQGLNMDALMQPSIDPESGFAEGHAHLYINGEKVQRIYGHSVHMPDALFKPGLNQINVSINNHGHMYWTADGRQILATLYVDMGADDLVVHRFESYPSIKVVDGTLCTEDTPIQGG